MPTKHPCAVVLSAPKHCSCQHTSCVQMQSPIWFNPGLAQTYFVTAAASQAQAVTYPALNTRHNIQTVLNWLCPGTDGCSRFPTWSLGNAVLGSSGEGRSWTPHQLASCRQGSQHTPSQVDTDVQAACTKPAGEINACLLICQWPAQQTLEISYPQINTYATKNCADCCFMRQFSCMQLCYIGSKLMPDRHMQVELKHNHRPDLSQLHSLSLPFSAGQAD